VEGDLDELQKGLAKMPYKSVRNGLDIVTLYSTIQSSVKKNEPGESQNQTK
jgi:uncharacterized protein YfbU (UPF0304 family)